MRINHKVGEGSPSFTNFTPEWVRTLKEGDFHLFIGTPSRNQQCYIGYASSLAHTVAALVSGGVEVTMEQVRSSCFADTARNLLLAKFMKSKATHILMIDDDMSWTPLAPLKMLAMQKEFIAGAGPVKGEKRFAAEYIGPAEDGLVELMSVGGAFIMMSREMIVKMAEEYKHLSHPMYDGFPRLFEDQYTPTQWITEDYVFCDRWRQIGGKIYGYPDIYFEHLGQYAVEGNYQTYLNAELLKMSDNVVKNLPPVDMEISKLGMI